MTGVRSRKSLGIVFQGSFYIQRRIVMNEQEFEKQLNALHDRVLSKALSDEEKNNYTESLFESIRHVNKYGQEFWYARDLQIALEYTEWRNFCKVIEKAKEACRGSNNAVSDHFVDVNKMVRYRVITTSAGFFCLFNNLAKVSPLSIFQSDL